MSFTDIYDKVQTVGPLREYLQLSGPEFVNQISKFKFPPQVHRGCVTPVHIGGTMKLLMSLAVSLLAQSAFALDIDFKSCAVVKVGEARNTILEEGLGSIYELDWDGYADADGDSTSGSISIKGKKVKLSLGQGGWNSENVRIQIKSFTYQSEMSNNEVKGVELEVEEGTAGALYWRIFPDYRIAIVKYTGPGGYKNSHLATLDCSGVTDVRNR